MEEKQEDFEYAVDIAATVSHEQQVIFVTVIKHSEGSLQM